MERELASYGDLAVRLVNSEVPGRPDRDALGNLDGLRRLLSSVPRWQGRVAASDLPRLRLLRSRLRRVFLAAAEGHEPQAVAALNELLAAAVLRPQISGHDGERWHLHISEGAPDVVTAYTAAAVMGLATQVTEVGLDRCGICSAAPCRNVFVDTSANRSRRYCSDRCATRANVAAFRARRRAALAEPR